MEQNEGEEKLVFYFIDTATAIFFSCFFNLEQKLLNYALVPVNNEWALVENCESPQRYINPVKKKKQQFSIQTFGKICAAFPSGGHFPNTLDGVCLAALRAAEIYLPW